MHKGSLTAARILPPFSPPPPAHLCDIASALAPASVAPVAPISPAIALPPSSSSLSNSLTWRVEGGEVRGVGGGA